MKQLTSPTQKDQKEISIERVSFLINNKGIEPVIAEIDLEMIKAKLQNHEEGLGWTVDQCNQAEIQYKRFLHLNKKFPDITIVPHKTMDLMWHQHILDTRAYHRDCKVIFGRYFHHFPYFGMRGEKDKQNLIFAFIETQNIYEQEFGENMIHENVSACKSGCNSSGKCKS